MSYWNPYRGGQADGALREARLQEEIDDLQQRKRELEAKAENLFRQGQDITEIENEIADIILEIRDHEQQIGGLYA